MNVFLSLREQPLRRIVAATLIVVLAAMPFHGFLSTWIGSSLDQLELAKAWKEIALAALLIPISIDMARNPKEAKEFFANRIHQLIFAYGLLHFVHGLFSQPPLDAFVVSLLINGRFLLIFLIARWLTWRNPLEHVRARILRWIVVALGFSALFAVLQVFVLPQDLLEMFGYGPDTIPAEYTLDDNDDLRRYGSLTRGPNVFGVMLVVLIALIADRFYRMRGQFLKVSRGHQLNILLTIFVVAVGLFASYSRSGWLAAAIAVAVVLWLGLPAAWRQRSAIAAVPVTVVLVIGGISLANNNAFFSTILLHDSPDSGQITSTEDRFMANRDAIDDIVEQPLGDGPGTAGPASFYNNQQTRIAENYYLQIGQELGVIGMALFVGIVALTGQQLYKNRDEELPRILLASLIGLSVAALFAHTWADEEVALIWWGLAGLYLPTRK